LAALALASGGCEVPKFKGPQIQQPPPAFSMKHEAEQGVRMFPDREVAFHEAWVEASWGNFSGIYINGHPGVITVKEVEQARQTAIARPSERRGEFTPLETLRIDDRKAWGWTEKWWGDNGGLDYVAYRAVIPYDTITYAVEFLTGEPGLKSHPDSLRTIVASFAVGRVRWNMPLLVLAALAGLLALKAVWSRASHQPYDRSRNMKLVQIPVKGEAEEEAGTASEPGGDPAPPPAPPT